MRAHLVQYDIAWENPDANFERIDCLLAGASVEQNDLILLPEMFDTGFSFRIETTSDDEDVSSSWLARLASMNGAYVQGGITTRGPGDKGLNRALIFSPNGEILTHYDKIHPFTFGREGERFARGSQVTTFTMGNPDDPLVACPAICYDLRFPELFRAGLALGADAFTLGANWPVARQAHWHTLAQARAIENQAFLLAVNRTGSDPHLRYVGGSVAIDPQGRILAKAGEEEIVLSVEINPEEVRSWRATFPAWRDQSPALGQFDAQKASKTV